MLLEEEEETHKTNLLTKQNALELNLEELATTVEVEAVEASFTSKPTLVPSESTLEPTMSPVLLEDLASDVRTKPRGLTDGFNLDQKVKNAMGTTILMMVSWMKINLFSLAEFLPVSMESFRAALTDLPIIPPRAHPEPQVDPQVDLPLVPLKRRLLPLPAQAPTVFLALTRPTLLPL